ncbi:MAG: ABC transporter permease subunit [Ilumatobacteraceae bacterium]
MVEPVREARCDTAALRFTTPPRQVAGGVRGAVGVVVGIVLFPPTGIVALVLLLKARRIRFGDTRAARHAYDRSKQWCVKSLGFAAALWVVVALVAILLVDDRAMIHAFFDREVLREALPSLLEGFWFTVKLCIVAEAAVLAWGLTVAVVRTLPGDGARPLRALATIYVDVFRAMPALLVIMVVVLGVKQTSMPFFSDLSDFQLVVVALVLVFGSYAAEIFRAGIELVHHNQVDAARTLGMGQFAALRTVILPQAFRAVLPPLLNSFISLQKDAALVMLVGLLDAVNWAYIQSIQHANLSPFVGVAAGYLAMTLPLTRITDHLGRRHADKIRGA